MQPQQTDNDVKDFMTVLDKFVTESNNPVKARDLSPSEQTRLYKVGLYAFGHGMAAVKTEKNAFDLITLIRSSPIKFRKFIATSMGFIKLIE